MSASVAQLLLEHARSYNTDHSGMAYVICRCGLQIEVGRQTIVADDYRAHAAHQAEILSQCRQTIPAEAVEVAEAFPSRYLGRSSLTREQLMRVRVVATCGCGDAICEGYQVVAPENLMPWLEETVVIA